MDQAAATQSNSQAPSEEAKPPSASEEAQPPSFAGALGLAAKLPHSRTNYPTLFPDLSINRPRPVKSPRHVFEPVIGSETEVFRQKFYPEITSIQWNDWQWQIQNRITTRDALERFLRLSPDELAAFQGAGGSLPLSITPYYLSLVDPDNPDQPLRRAVTPTWRESHRGPGEEDDPLGEDHDTVSPGLVHRYPDRVLFLVTGFCSTYCRYCTRSRLVAGHSDDCRYDQVRLEKGLEYIRKTTSVRDVLLSGGDPLTLPDEKLEWVLKRLARIKHVELIRIGTKAPAVLPQRITPSLLRILRRHQPLFMSIHFTHPDELTPETAQACNRLANAGVPLGSQTVLLKGV
ncbi:MAG: KamA family radical SAM protein, partial [Deltaproteobacteria bacterium]|nr:KamA family radical SAM protein [Deltaproteobacteria bacterium]